MFPAQNVSMSALIDDRIIEMTYVTPNCNIWLFAKKGACFLHHRDSDIIYSEEYRKKGFLLEGEILEHTSH